MIISRGRLFKKSCSEPERVSGFKKSIFPKADGVMGCVALAEELWRSNRSDCYYDSVIAVASSPSIGPLIFASASSTYRWTCARTVSLSLLGTSSTMRRVSKSFMMASKTARIFLRSSTCKPSTPSSIAFLMPGVILLKGSPLDMASSRSVHRCVWQFLPTLNISQKPATRTAAQLYPGLQHTFHTQGWWLAWESCPGPHHACRHRVLCHLKWSISF